MANNSERVASAADLVPYTNYLMFVDVYCCLQAVISSLGMIGNIVNIKTFIAMGLGDGVSVSFLALSVSDLGFLSMNLAVSVSQGLSGVEKKSGYATYFPIDPLGMYFFFAHVGAVWYANTIMITTFLAIARCLCVVRPLHFKNVFTRRRCIWILSGFGILSVGGYFPVLYYMGIVKQFDKHTNASRPLIWISPQRELVKDVIWGARDNFFIPATELVVIVCVIVMANALREASYFRQTTTTRTSTIVKGRNQRLGSQKLTETVAKDVTGQNNTLGRKSNSHVKNSSCNLGSSENSGKVDQPQIFSSVSEERIRGNRRQQNVLNESENQSGINEEAKVSERGYRNVKDGKPQGSMENGHGRNYSIWVCQRMNLGIKDGGNVTSKKLGGKELQVVQQIVLISLVYIVCNTPQMVVSLAGALEPEFTFGKLYNNMYLIMLNVTQIVMMFNSSINVFVYYHYNSKFRSLCRGGCRGLPAL